MASNAMEKKRLEVEMDFEPLTDGSSSPFVGYFPCGFNPLTQDNCQASVEVRAYQNTNRYKARQYQVVAQALREEDGVDFVGTNYTGEAAVWQPVNYALGVFDKENKALKLVPLSGGKIFRMEPRVREVEYEGDPGKVEVEHEQWTKETMLQKRNLLTATFGSHKSRLQLSRLERGRVKEDVLGDREEIEALFEHVGKTSAVLTASEALEQADSSVRRNIPPHDPLATSPENAYLIDEIITMDERTSLRDMEMLRRAARDHGKAQKLREENQYPAFVLNRLSSLCDQNDERNTMRAIILSYIRHLLAFYHLPRHCIKHIVDPVSFHEEIDNSKAIDLRAHLNIPHAVAVKILKCFTSSCRDVMSGNMEVRTQTADNRNLLISYILVLGLMIDGFQVDPYDLAVELKVAVSKLKPYYLMLGCKYIKQEKTGMLDQKGLPKAYKVVLHVPLEFPTMIAKRRRM
eukprot:c23346_g1_i1 orf=74-1456(+)